jgi:drug/metabolite transporter (DMT)-like permease
MWGLGQLLILGIVAGYYVPRATLYWVLPLVYVGPQATHPYSGYCWLMWRLGQHTLLGIVVGLCGVLLLAMLRLGQQSLLGIVVGL